MKRVLAFGTFDRLHEGHRHFLEQVRSFGDELIVVIARDKTVKEVKQHTALEPESTRLQHVQELACVTRAVLGGTGDKMEVVAQIKPDIICLGYDQTHFVSLLQEYIRDNALEIEVKRLDAFHPEKYKSSKLNPRS